MQGLLKRYKETYFLLHAGITSLIFGILIILSFFFWDIPLARFFHAHPFWTSFFTFFYGLTEPKIVQVLFWPVIFYIVRFLLRKKEAGNALLLIFLAVVLSNVTTDILKWVIGRERPDLLFSQNFYGFTPFSASHHSFPSGHACTYGAIFLSLACIFPRYSFAFLGVSFVVSLGRVFQCNHFLSDIFGGIWVGMMVSQFIYVTMRREGFTFKKTR